MYFGLITVKYLSLRLLHSLVLKDVRGTFSAITGQYHLAEKTRLMYFLDKTNKSIIRKRVVALKVQQQKLVPKHNGIIVKH